MERLLYIVRIIDVVSVYGIGMSEVCGEIRAVIVGKRVIRWSGSWGMIESLSQYKQA